MKEFNFRLPARGRTLVAFAALLSAFLWIGVLAASPASAAVIRIPDVGGEDTLDQSNDPGASQVDLAGVFVDGNTFGFAWDETDLTGNNSSDTCTYFQETDGTVTAVCYSVQYEDDGSITSGFPKYEAFDCTDTYSNGKCTGNLPISGEYSVVCTDPVVVEPYFAGDDNQDLEASCTLSGIGGNNPADLQLVNTCTKPSASPPSNNFDCLFDGVDPGFLSLEKVVQDGTATPVDFTLTAANGTDSISGAGSVTSSLITAGDITLTESSSLLDDGSYELVDIVCTAADGSDVPVASGVATIDELQTVHCVYTNKVAFIANPVLSFDKSVALTSDGDGDGDAEFGDTLTYTFVATNDGNVDLTDVTIVDSLDGLSALDCTPAQPATLAPTESLECTATYVIDLDDVAAGQVVNSAVADSAETDPEDDSETTPVVPNPLLGFDKTVALTIDGDGDGDAELGDTLTYTFVASNDGDTTLTDVTVVDSLAGLSALDCTPAQPATLAPTESLECTATYVIDADDVAAGQVVNSAVADSTETGPEDDSETTPVISNPAYEISKELTSNADEDGNGEVSLDDTLTYTVTVTNTGDVVMDLSVTDSLITPNSNTCDAVIPTGTCSLTGTYVVDQDDVDAGEVLNTATASSNLLDDITADVEVDVPQVIAVSIDKVTNGSDDSTILVGSPVTWTYEVTNDGNTTVDNIAVADSDPSVTVSCPVTTLAPGASTTCTASGTATAGDYTNTGTVTADGPQDQPATDNDDSGYFGANPSFTIDKVTTTSDGTGDGVLAVEGEAVTWTYTINNDGNVDLSGIVVTDDVQGAVCTVDVAAGQSTTCTLSGTAIEGAYANVGSGDADYTDDGGNSADITDSDDSSYIGIIKNQPSIALTAPSISEDGNNGFTGTTTVTNESDGGTPDTIYITDFTVTVEKLGKKNTSELVDAVCTVDGQPTGDLADPIVVNDSTDLSFSCVTADGSALDGRHRITIEAEIFNRDKVFSERTTYNF